MLGSLEKIESHTLFSNKAISLASGKPFPTLIARSFFRAEVSSRLLLEFKNVDGVLNAKVAECPLLPTPEPNAEYDFASLYEKRIGNPTETAEIKLRPTTYVIQLTPEMEKHVSATLKAALEERRKRFPSFYEVGVQLLVVAIPIIVTSFLT
jgi:hypothetical protein